MSTVSLPALSQVAVCGGTHGNELSGVYLVREYLRKRKQPKEQHQQQQQQHIQQQQQQQPQQKRERQESNTYTLRIVMGNPRAVQQCRRYTETDLNRCFTQACLDVPTDERTPYEMVRSKELNALLGPKGSARATDLVCDVHNTTANMGLCFLAFSDSDWICLHIYRHLQRELATIPVRYINFDKPTDEAYSLDTVGKHGFAMEIGPQPHGSIRSNIFVAMQEGVELMLEWIHLFNSGTQFEGGSVEVFTLVKNIDYPRDPDTNTITAAIHPELQDRDFCLLHPGDPLFLSFSGETLRYKGKEALYPFFVNECAYYEKGIALSLASRKRVVIPSIQCDRER